MENPNIKSKLAEIESKQGIYILFAIESGSRVWRMESKDSDYDVRFVFLRNNIDYLRINKQAEVIEYKYEDIDIVGFDLYKFIRLLLSSNPLAIEWLESDIIYCDDGETKDKLKVFIEEKFNPISLYYHYKSMCKQNYIKYLKSGEKMTHKKYLYCMRGLVNALGVTQFKTLPPIDFNKEINNINHIPDNVIFKLKEVIGLKKEGFEEIAVSKIHLFGNYIESFLSMNHELENRKITDYSELQNYIWKKVGGFTSASPTSNEGMELTLNPIPSQTNNRNFRHYEILKL